MHVIAGKISTLSGAYVLFRCQFKTRLGGPAADSAVARKAGQQPIVLNWKWNYCLRSLCKGEAGKELTK